MPKTLDKPRRVALTSLPTPDGGYDDLEQMAAAFGDEATFAFIGEARDHRGESLISQFRAQLGAALVNIEGGNHAEARRAVADRLGYKPTSRPNFYKVEAIGQANYDGRIEQVIVDSRTGRRPKLRRLPAAAEGFDGLVRLVEAYGAEATYMFLAYLRDPNASVVGQFRANLAARMVAAERGTYEEARRAVADRLRIGDTERTNFYKLVEAGQRGLTGRYHLLNRR